MLHLRHNGVDTYTFYAVFLRGLYDTALPLPRGSTVVDLGANIGLTAAYFAMHAADIRLFVVEPEVNNIVLLQRNLEGIGASIQRAAVSDQTGQAHMELRGTTANVLVDTPTTPGIETQGTPTVTLDDIRAMVGNARVELMKVDIEGSESRVFAANLGLLEQCHRIIIEIHSPDARTALAAKFATVGFHHHTGLHADDPDLFIRRAKAGVASTP